MSFPISVLVRPLCTLSSAAVCLIPSPRLSPSLFLPFHLLSSLTVFSVRLWHCWFPTHILTLLLTSALGMGFWEQWGLSNHLTEWPTPTISSLKKKKKIPLQEKKHVHNEIKKEKRINDVGQNRTKPVTGFCPDLWPLSRGSLPLCSPCRAAFSPTSYHAAVEGLHIWAVSPLFPLSHPHCQCQPLGGMKRRTVGCVDGEGTV